MEILSEGFEILINDQIKISSHLFTWTILVQKEYYFALIIQLDCCGVMIMTHLCCSFSLKLRLWMTLTTLPSASKCRFVTMYSTVLHRRTTKLRYSTGTRANFDVLYELFKHFLFFCKGRKKEAPK